MRQRAVWSRRPEVELVALASRVLLQTRVSGGAARSNKTVVMTITNPEVTKVLRLHEPRP